MKNQNIINSLKNNGFTEYEAKVYLSLLKSYPANGNRIAKSSGVPGPKVYETLRKMQEKGYVFLVKNGDKSSNKRYYPLPYEDLLSSFEKEFTENLNLLHTSFEMISSSSDQEWSELFHMEGYETSIEVIKNEIDHSSQEIIMSCWAKEFDALFSHLAAAQKRGVKVVTMLFDQTTTPIPWSNFFHYPSTKVDDRHFGELSIVIDDKKVVVFEAKSANSSGVVSSHQSMVKTTRNYIRHDIYVNRIMNDFDQDLKKLYGEQLERLIDDF
ncbi:MAG: hypothetical protein LPK26_07030 [Bacillaceae bacterium]|nr:hypothetical protein [Bacillaceae bacterium]